MYAVAIDGPSSSGKSTVAKEVAKRLNILHLNTGALYRALGYFAYQNKIFNDVDEKGMPIIKQEDVDIVVNNAHINVEFIDGKQHTILNGEDISDSLHTPIMSDYSSRVSAIPEIRQHILTLQRNIAKENNIVMEGRDIASHVLTDAKYKFFVTASAEVRAERRYKENVSKGIECDYNEIVKDLQQRDLRDTTRKVCPLIIVDDAVVIDTSNLTVEEAVNKILSYIKE